jgi:hypothetical protein
MRSESPPSMAKPSGPKEHPHRSDTPFQRQHALGTLVESNSVIRERINLAQENGLKLAL